MAAKRRIKKWWHPEDRRVTIDQVIQELPWDMAEDLKQRKMKALRERPPLDLAGVERLYYKTLGLSEDEIQRRMDMGRTHQLKIWPEFFKMLQEGKNFEVRKNDRDYQVGDELVLNEWDQKLATVPEEGAVRADHKTYNSGYTGASIRAIVRSVVCLSEVPDLGELIIKGQVKKAIELGTYKHVSYVVLGLDIIDNPKAMPIISREVYRMGASWPATIMQMANLMAGGLLAHNEKGPADQVHRRLSRQQLVEGLRQQVHELDQATLDLETERYVNMHGISVKAANVGNYAMFLVNWALSALKRDKKAVSICLMTANQFAQATQALNLLPEDGVDVGAFIENTEFMAAETVDGKETGRVSHLKVISIEPYPSDGPEAGSRGKIMFLEPVAD